jgi:TRAP-type C4-dicarboxylate transport system permease small subunit
VPRASPLAGEGLLVRLANAVATAMAVVVFVIFMVKIVCRYAFDIQLAWADEVCAILFVWIIFWTNATLIPNRQQISFNLVLHTLPPRGQRVVAVLRTLIVGGLFAAALPASISYIRFLWREHTPVLQLPLDWVYSCFALFMIGVILRSVVALFRPD